MKSFISICTGSVLLFVLQLISYVNYLLVDGGLYNGVLDKYYLLKTWLVLIPFGFIIYGIGSYFLVTSRKNPSSFLHHKPSDSEK